MTNPIAARTIMLLIAAATLLAGCEKDLIKAPPAGRDDLLRAESYPQIVAVEGLGEWLRFGKPLVTPTDGANPMSVSIPLRSVYDKIPLNIQYQFEFLDNDGRPTGPAPGWVFAHLEPRVMEHIGASALDARATDWRVTVRSAR